MATTENEQGFLHAMISRRYLPERETLALYNELHEESDALESVHELDQALASINRKLRIVHIELRKGAVPPENAVYWGVVNGLSDSFTHHLTTLTPDEVAVFFGIANKILMEDIETGDLGFNEARNIGEELVEDEAESGSQRKPIRPMAVEEAIAKLCSRGWMVVRKENRDKRVALGVRSYLELPEVKEWFTKRLMNASLQQPSGEATQEQEVDDDEPARASSRRSKRRRT